MLILVALGLSALGDAFLAGDPKKWLLAGMAAFFAAHVAYIPLFWDGADAARPLFVLGLQVALTFGAAFFVRSLLPWIDKPMRWPVLAYGIVILLMGNAALRLEPTLLLATIGALMFITSDAILSLELFRMADNHRLRPVTARLVWALYYGGQALIAAAFIPALSL